MASKFEPAELRSHSSRKSRAQDQERNSSKEQRAECQTAQSPGRVRKRLKSKLLLPLLSTQSSHLSSRIKSTQTKRTAQGPSADILSGGGRIDPFLHTLFINHHHPTKEHSTKLQERELSPSRFHFQGCTDLPMWTANGGDLITAQNFNSFNYPYQKEFFLVIIQVLSVPLCSSKSSPPPAQVLLRRCAGFRHFVQGRAGITPALFKEDTEQRQCPAPLPAALSEAEQLPSKAGSTPKKKPKKTWSEMSLKEISPAECFRHSKNTFSPTVNFACQVAKH